MPTLLLVRGLRFFFYSNENNEPPHIHITKGNANGKIWLTPFVKIEYLHGFTSSEEHDIIEIVGKNCEQFETKWYEYFGK